MDSSSRNPPCCCGPSNSAAAEIPILYGGSGKPGNAGELLAAEGVDGLLVGGASLEAGGFAAICNA